jgi:hypothetical protein
MTASSAAGELALGDLELPGQAGVQALRKAAEAVPSPIGGIFRGIGGYIGGIFKIFTKPLRLICVVLLGVLWVFLAKERGSDSTAVSVLSWLTFSEGGFDRELPGTILGILGKGTVGAALISLLSGGLPKLFKGIGALFTGHGEKRGFFRILFWLVIGAAVYFAFVGEYASGETAMAGIGGAILSLEALGGGSGKLYALASSLTAKKIDGVRTAMRGRCDGLLTGLTLGFGLAAALSAAGIVEELL